MSLIFTNRDIRGGQAEPLRADEAWLIGQAFSEWTDDLGSMIVSASEDATSATIESLIKGLLLNGRDVKKIIPGDEYALANEIASINGAAGAYVSKDSNQGVDVNSLYTAQGVLVEGDDLNDIHTLVDTGNIAPATVPGELLS